MTQAPREFVLITIIGLVVGTITGYIVDYYNIGAWVRKRSAKTQIPDVEREHDKAEALLDELYCEEPLTCRSSKLRHIGHEEGDEIDLILHHAEPLTPRGGTRSPITATLSSGRYLQSDWYSVY